MTVPATVCTCIGRMEVRDGMGRWLVDVSDPECPAHRESEE